MTPPASTFLTKLAQQLSALSQKQVTGTLVLGSSTVVGQIQVVGGRFLGVKGGPHQNRRWQRCTQQYCPKLKPDFSAIKQPNNWEAEVLVQGLIKKEISLKEAKLALFNICVEFFFELAQYADLKMQWKPETPVSSNITLQLALSFEEIKPSLIKGIQLYQQWQQAGLGKLNPNLAPFVQPKIPPSAMGGLGAYLNGQFVIWDLALKSQKTIILITRSFIPLVQKKVLQFKKLPDITIQINPNTSEQTILQVAQKTYLIACIDDSPAVGNTMERILKPKGYKVMPILDPMRGMAILLKDKPDLIFLDVVMPNANGYDLCQSLRKMAVFKTVPIIILSARDTDQDRAMAKKVGANDFLSKPPKPDEILQMVQRYLK